MTRIERKVKEELIVLIKGAIREITGERKEETTFSNIMSKLLKLEREGENNPFKGRTIIEKEGIVKDLLFRDSLYHRSGKRYFYGVNGKGKCVSVKIYRIIEDA